MAKTMRAIAVIFSLLTIGCLISYAITNERLLIPFTITFATTAYHFVMRLMVGAVVDNVMHNNADYHKKWYSVSDVEMKLYQKIKIKKWKKKMPTFDAETFDVSKHSWDEVAQATCQSEVVHEINIVLSFLPLVLSIWFGEFWIFLITSILGATYDLMFVMMQRFNRTRILKMKRRSQK